MNEGAVSSDEFRVSLGIGAQWSRNISNQLALTLFLEAKPPNE
jgi:hypothetical protein